MNAGDGDVKEEVEEVEEVEEAEEAEERGGEDCEKDEGCG